MVQHYRDILPRNEAAGWSLRQRWLGLGLQVSITNSSRICALKQVKKKDAVMDELTGKPRQLNEERYYAKPTGCSATKPCRSHTSFCFEPSGMTPSDSVCCRVGEHCSSASIRAVENSWPS